MKTPMQELRDKILQEVQNLKESAQSNDRIGGYREALKNIANDIDAQMLDIERTAIIEAHDNGYMDGANNKSIAAEAYYDSTYKKK